MKTKKNIFAIFFAVIMCFAVVGCGGGGKDDGEIELLVDLHGWMPTINTTPTLENPKVIRASALIADAFYEETGIKVKWARSKPVGGLEAELSEWFSIQVSGNSCPAIAFSWGTRFQDREYYMDLTDIVKEPNEFVEGNEKWSDMFEDYLWEDGTIINAADRVVAVPISLYAGTSTGYFYNKDIFSELTLSVPKTFEEYVASAKKINDAGYVGSAPWGYFKKYTLGAWIIEQSIGPSIAYQLMDVLDTDEDGRVSTQEKITAVKNNVFSPNHHDYAKEMYRQAKRYYTEVLPDGWLSTDYMNSWDTGKVGMKEEGVWAMYDQMNQPAIDYEVGIFPIPQFSIDSSEFATQAEYTEKGPYNPRPDLALNIMKPAVKDNPKLMAAAVKFLKYLTIPENITLMCEEQGAALGAVKGSGYNSILDEYFDQPFPKAFSNVSWPAGFTSGKNDSLDRSFGLWVLDSKTDKAFYDDVDKYMKEGAAELAGKMGLTY